MAQRADKKWNRKAEWHMPHWDVHKLEVASAWKTCRLPHVTM